MRMDRESTGFLRLLVSASDEERHVRVSFFYSVVPAELSSTVLSFCFFFQQLKTLTPHSVPLGRPLEYNISLWQTSKASF